MKLTITTTDRGCGNHCTILEEPYASALANIDGLAHSPNNRTYRGVRFGSGLAGKLVIYFSPWQFGRGDEWATIAGAGVGTMDVPQPKLDAIIAASAAIDAVIEKAVPAQARATT